MKQIKLTGRERSVLRYVDWASGSTGEELLENTKLEPEDLVDVINALMEVGYMEMVPYAHNTDLETFRGKTFEVNPSYALELKASMIR
jgi:DNA-binding MarR family transcriptional regulator